ncbi:unnamed protein product, partial [Brassica oleracea]
MKILPGGGADESKIGVEQVSFDFFLCLYRNFGRETDSKQVPRGKDEKDFEKRVKECLKLSGGSLSC